ncbi:hypothetical protein R80B4_03237 [Fibrobacteres bacterium R8-0-B4]
MYRIDTEEKLNWLLEGLESGDIVVGGANPTEQDFAEISREINEYRALSRKNRRESTLTVSV